jgi:hypothetical protein
MRSYKDSDILMQGQNSSNALDSDFPSGTSSSGDTMFDGGSVSSNGMCLTNGYPLPWPSDAPIPQDAVPKMPIVTELPGAATPDTEIIEPLRHTIEGYVS